MKPVSKLLGLTLAVAALLLSACAKKPIRAPQDTQQLGGPTVNPEDLAVPGENINLESRDLSLTPDAANQSVVEPIYFAFDRFAVAPAERPKLQNALKWLQDNPGKNLVLVGHCDWRGTAEYNLGLGENRANSVKRYLVSLGADATRLETLSKGSTEAKQTGGEAEWAKDRRVDFIELKKQ
ncbi:MAG: OmpA family protein [Verrucomicrobiota bacterium]